MRMHRPMGAARAEKVNVRYLLPDVSALASSYAVACARKTPAYWVNAPVATRHVRYLVPDMSAGAMARGGAEIA